MPHPRSAATFAPRATCAAACACVFACVALAPLPAVATPRALPFTYPVHTLPKGVPELEQYIDIIPTRVSRERADGTLEGVMSHRYVLQTEFEYGITDRLEGAFYLLWRQGAGIDTAALRFAGVKQRLRYRFTSEEDFPIGIAGYFEVAELSDEFEVEEKLILGQRFGRLHLLANLWFEQEHYFQVDQTKFIYNPAVGATWEISPAVNVGLEYWARGRFGSSGTPTGDVPTSTSHYLGPTLLLQGKTMWWSIGAYAGLHTLGKGFQLDAPYGPLWVRTLLGIDL